MSNEKRPDLIDRNALKHAFCSNCNAEYSEEPCEPSECLLCNTVDQQPTVDAVEVVRCKDCRFWGQDVCGSTGEDESFCTNPDGLDNFAHPDDFCSYGERKDNDRI